MDIHAGVIAAVVLSFLGALWIFRSGIRALQSARRLTFYRIRRQRERGGWTTILVAILLLGSSVLMALIRRASRISLFPSLSHDYAYPNHHVESDDYAFPYDHT